MEGRSGEKLRSTLEKVVRHCMVGCALSRGFVVCAKSGPVV